MDFSYWPCIATMKPDGSAMRMLMACDEGGPDAVAAPDWSATGARLLFLRGDRPAVAAADGSRQRIVPLAERQGFWSDKPSFAPDGRHFAYTRPSSAGSQPEVWRASVDGKQDRFVRKGWLPRWSPDGKTIAYVDPKAGMRSGLMNARTGKRIRTIGPEADSMDWSPDARWLVYTPAVCCSDSRRDVFVVRADGTGSRRRLVTSKHWQISQPLWSPDGRRIAFVRSQDNGIAMRVQVWTMNTGGRDKQRIYSSGWLVLFDDNPFDVGLSWRPRRG
jgi:Tol biopolymer transport system component